MVCEKCEKKLEKLCTPEVWKDGKDKGYVQKGGMLLP